jgi:hypothetical protein
MNDNTSTGNETSKEKQDALNQAIPPAKNGSYLRNVWKLISKYIKKTFSGWDRTQKITAIYCFVTVLIFIWNYRMFREIRKEFTVEHAPNLAFGNLVFQDYEFNKEQLIKYSIYNISRQVAHIREIRTGFITTSSLDNEDFGVMTARVKMKDSVVNAYMTSFEYPIFPIADLGFTLDSTIDKKITSGENLLIIEIKYINTTSGDWRRYIFAGRVDRKTNTIKKVFWNDNLSID